MTAHALTGPYWRWRRYWRFRRPTRQTRPAKPWNGVVVAATAIVALVTFDQLTKLVFVTPEWGWHYQPTHWLFQSFLVSLVCLALTLFEQTRLFAIFAAAGSIGNTLSDLHSGVIANPFVTGVGNGHVAFNVADVLLYTSFGLAFYAAFNVARTYQPRRHP